MCIYVRLLLRFLQNKWIIIWMLSTDSYIAKKAPKILKVTACLQRHKLKECLQVTHSVSTTLLKCFLSSKINHSDCNCCESQLLSYDEVLTTAKILLALSHEAQKQRTQVTKTLHFKQRLDSPCTQHPALLTLKQSVTQHADKCFHWLLPYIPALVCKGPQQNWIHFSEVIPDLCRRWRAKDS